MGSGEELTAGGQGALTYADVEIDPQAVVDSGSAEATLRVLKIRNDMMSRHFSILTEQARAARQKAAALRYRTVLKEKADTLKDYEVMDLLAQVKLAETEMAWCEARVEQYQMELSVYPGLLKRG